MAKISRKVVRLLPVGKKTTAKVLSAHDDAVLASLLVQTIAANATRDNMDEWAPKIIEIFNGDIAAWYIYDTEHWNDPGFWAVRSVRNHPHWGQELFKTFR